MNKEWAGVPENIDIEAFKKQLGEEIEKLNLNQLRRLAMNLDIVDSDESVLNGEKGFKEKIYAFMEKQNYASMLKVIENKIRLAIEQTEK